MMFRRSLLLVLAFIALWQLVVWLLAVPIYFIPAPGQVFAVIWARPWFLLMQTLPTVFEAVAGMLLAVLVGVVLAISMSLSARARFWLLPLVVASQALPMFALAPILIIWLGYGMISKITVVAIVLFFPIASTLFYGLRQTAQDYLDLAGVYQASKLRTLWLIRLPAALPRLGYGLKMAAAWAPISAVIAEWVGASQGLGFIMINASAQLQTDLVFAAIVILMVISLAFYGLVALVVEKKWDWL